MASTMIKIITCKLDKANVHLLKQPKVLPCGYSVCVECIEKALTKNGLFKCNFDKCQSVHEIGDNPYKLVSNVIAEEALNENLCLIAEEFYSQLQERFSCLKDEFVEKEQNIESIFNTIDRDVHSRFESIKNELDKLERDLLTISKSMKIKFLKRLKLDFEHIEQNFKFHKEMAKSKDEDGLKRNLYQCQEFLNELNNFNLNFYEKLKHISFTSSKWFPSLNIIGEIVRNDFINLEKIRFRTPKLISFDKRLKSMNRLWNFNDEELFLTGSDDNKILVLDNSFTVINEINEIDGMELSAPTGICSDNTENVYICDYGAHRVLIVNRTFTKIKKIIGKRGSAISEFVDPLDICFYANSLYVLDREIKRIQEFTRAGDFVREIKLYEVLNSATTDSKNCCFNSNSSLNDRKLLTRPVRMCISNGVIAILDSFRRVYIYNLRGEFKQLIESSHSNMLMCLISDYLFTCNREGLLMCYQRNQIYNYDGFKLLFERSIDCLKSSKSYMHYFDDQLVFLLTDNKALAVL